MKTDIIVVLGLDSDKKPRAAKFDVADEKAVHNAAAAQGLKIGRPKSDEAVEIATRLVDGKIFSSGKSLLPLIKAETYDRLLKLLEIEDPKADAVTVKPSPAPTPGKPVTISVLIPDPWFKIAVGTIVLFPNDGKGKDRSWWECTVTSISKDGKLLTVRWTHYPTEKPFNVKLTAVAILPAKG
jgi:hypothetical protein